MLYFMTMISEVALEKILKIHRMEIVWTFIGNRMIIHS